MGASVYVSQNAILFADLKNKTINVDINACSTIKCKKNGQDTESKFCNECGNKIEKISVEKALNNSLITDFINNNLDDIIVMNERQENKIMLHDSALSKHSGDLLESEYDVIDELTQNERETLLNTFTEKHNALLLFLKDNNIEYSLNIKILTECSC
jgi:hypothetical protein